MISLAPMLVDELESAARAEAPLEWCAVGVGPVDAVTHLVHLTNVHPSPGTNFRADPVALARVLRTARGLGHDVTLIAHSHPSGEATPSMADRIDGCDWPGIVHAIVVADAPDPVRCWRIADNEVVEVAHG